MQRRTCSQKDRQTYMHTYMQATPQITDVVLARIPTYKQANIQADRETDGEANTHADIQQQDRYT